MKCLPRYQFSGEGKLIDQKDRLRQELAAKYKMTPERVGQIYRAALADIRANLRQVGVRSPADAM